MILYEDNHLLVLNKPAALLTQPTSLEEESLERRGKQWIKETSKKQGNVFLEAAHRIDKPVSGIVVFAKTSKALSRLTSSIRDRCCEKIYEALVEERPPQDEGICEHYLIHDNYRARIVSKEYPGAKLARLSYRTLQSYKGFTRVQVHLETGRYHQIRIQFAALGCPILGDHKYGGQPLLNNAVIALHHKQITLPHPTKREAMVFMAPLPGHMLLEASNDGPDRPI